MSLELVQKQSQQLRMAPAMYQSVKLLQYNNLELADILLEKSLENPLLNFADSDRQADYFSYSGRDQTKSTTDVLEETLAQTVDFRERLHRDLHMLKVDKEYLMAADLLIDSLNDNGYLDVEPEEVLRNSGLNRDGMKQALVAVQSLDPAGIGARSLTDCLLLQLRRRETRNQLAETIISEYSNYFLTEDWTGLCQSLNVTEESVKKAVSEIRRLDPAPARNFHKESVQYVVPDMSIIKNGDNLALELEDRYLPKVTIARSEFELYFKNADDETKSYLRKKMNEANWLVSSLSKRRQTIIALAQLVMEHQRLYFLSGDEKYLQSLTMNQAAKQLQVAESTVSRTVANKYVQTPYGLYPLKRFFVKGIETRTGTASVFKIKSLIRTWINNEDKKKPLADIKLVDLLGEQGLQCSRRVVSKYRRECGIGSTVERREIR
ncbi:RNA polymerase factor sigma-54 [Sporolactobacillus sp. Y61]|uniref:RNA polymerase factor sigma-54 n=1 Tax=Sporolactobacillus sp. Y61 TaxID=3160863 RepID=A0AAU8IFV3_9BACL